MRIPTPWLLPALLALPLCGFAQDAFTVVPVPRATAVASSPTNRPFLAAADAAQPLDLAGSGYAEQEYLLGGLADLYRWGPAPSVPAQVEVADVPYATRLLVRRPVDARRFSGRVVVEVLDGSGGHDAAPLWGWSHGHLMARGDAWVGMTASAAAVVALQRFDPVRYAPLELPAPQPPQCLQANLAWTLVAQVGAMLRSSSKENPLLALDPRWLVAAGHGAAARQLLAYANALHGQVRLGGNEPVYDAFLAVDGAAAEAASSCEATLGAGDPRRGILPRDVPFVAVVAQGAAWPAGSRQDDDDPRDERRVYEVQGAAGAGMAPAGQPSAADLAIAGFPPGETSRCIDAGRESPLGFVLDAVWQQLAERLAGGMPLGAGGAWQLPQAQLPLGERDAAADGACDALRSPDAAALRQRYGSRNEYLRRFQGAVDDAVQARRLTAEDAATLKSSLAKSVPAF